MNTIKLVPIATEMYDDNDVWKEVNRSVISKLRSLIQSVYDNYGTLSHDKLKEEIKFNIGDIDISFKVQSLRPWINKKHFTLFVGVDVTIPGQSESTFRINNNYNLTIIENDRRRNFMYTKHLCNSADLLLTPVGEQINDIINTLGEELYKDITHVMKLAILDIDDKTGFVSYDNQRLGCDDYWTFTYPEKDNLVLWIEVTTIVDLPWPVVYFDVQTYYRDENDELKIKPGLKGGTVIAYIVPRLDINKKSSMSNPEMPRFILEKSYRVSEDNYKEYQIAFSSILTKINKNDPIGYYECSFIDTPRIPDYTMYGITIQDINIYDNDEIGFECTINKYYMSCANEDSTVNVLVGSDYFEVICESPLSKEFKID